jgi:hypothetical protein
MGQARQDGYGQGARKTEERLQLVQVIARIINDKNKSSLLFRLGPFRRLLPRKRLVWLRRRLLYLRGRLFWLCRQLFGLHRWLFGLCGRLWLRRRLCGLRGWLLCLHRLHWRL